MASAISNRRSTDIPGQGLVDSGLPTPGMLTRPAGPDTASVLGQARSEAIQACVSCLVPRDARLSPAQLSLLTTTLVTRADLWSDLVVHSPTKRWYLPLYRSDTCDVWLLAWEGDQDTDWHDHGGSSGSFAVAEGALAEQFRTPSGRQIRARRLERSMSVSFGPAHVHDVCNGDTGPSTSIHAYSPPLRSMTYYRRTEGGLVAEETVAVQGAEGPRREAGAVAPATGRHRPSRMRRNGVSQDAESDEARPGRGRPGPPPEELADLRGIDELLSLVRSGLDRVTPVEACAEVDAGTATIVDIRAADERALEGEIPGAVAIGRNVLEWRLDPRNAARIRALARFDARIIVVCTEGYASSLAAASLRVLGLERATDVIGGFRAFRAAGLSTAAGSPRSAARATRRAASAKDRLGTPGQPG